jgi:Tfp pilus assembly protein PilO
MNARDALARMPMRQLHLMGAAALLAAGAALWFGMLRAPLAHLRALHAEQARLVQATGGLARLRAQAAALDSSVRALTRQFGGAGGAAAHAPGDTEVQLGLMRDIGALAASSGVTLTALRPTPKQQALVFVQTGFDVEARGSYDALLAWLDALERSASRLAIERFEIHATRPAGTLELRARIAAYATEGMS